MRKSIIVVLAVFLFLIPAVGVAAFAGGDGSPATPFQITNCDQLQEMETNLSANYVLNNDIDCSDTVNWNSGKGFVPIYVFAGTFDGQGHKISGLFINGPMAPPPFNAPHYVGLFGITISGSIIKNVGLINVNIHGLGGAVGGLVGSTSYGVIINSYASGIVQGIYYVGGLVGNNYGGVITNSYSTGSVTGADTIGGLVGMNYDGGTITNSYSAGSVTGGWLVGGLVGQNAGGVITNSYWDTETSGRSTSAGGTGKTTAEMKQQSTFETWDFVDIWSINEGVSYPCLRWQITPDTAMATATKILAAIQLLPNSALKNANNKKAVLNKLNDAIASIDAGYYADALDLLKDGILGRTDGCATTGTPDKNDMLMTCSGQNQVYPLVRETIWIVEELLAP